MKDLVYKFLDNYAGNGYQTDNTSPLYDPFTFQPKISVMYSSDGGILILRLLMNDSGVTIKVNNILVDTIRGFIPVDEENCRSYVINWFCDRNKIKKEDLISNYIKENEKLLSTAYW
jgi:hypothetical protein